MAQFFQCPICRKAGVTLRALKAGNHRNEYFACRHCTFYAYCVPGERYDAEHMAALQAVNPGVRLYDDAS